MDDRLSALTERFRQLGAVNAECWAQSEIQEDLPQLAAFVFLRELWRLVIPIGDRKWLRSVRVRNDDGRGGALRRIKESGVNIDDLAEVVRAVQIRTIQGVVELLDMVDEPDLSVADIQWGLFELGDNYQPRRPIDGLHERVDDEDVIPQSLRRPTSDGR